MVMKQGKSGLLAKLGTAGEKAVKTHREDETQFDAGGNLPAGIEGGIAQLVDCKFDKYKSGPNQGEYYFLAAGIVRRPKEVNGIRLEGLRTQIGPEPLCDTPDTQGKRKSLDDRLAWVLNELRKLGVDTAELDLADLEATAEALKEEQPHFRFRTWQGKKTAQFPDPRVNHVWGGVCEFDDEDEEGTDVVDETAEQEDETEPEEDEEPEADESEDEKEEDLDALAKAADKDDEDAQARLTELCEEADVDPEKFKTWKQVVAALREAGESEDEDEEDEEEETEEEEAEEEEEEVTPEKGDVWSYRPPKSKKKIECEVTAVAAKARTVSLKNLDDGKTIYKNVSWDDISQD